LRVNKTQKPEQSRSLLKCLNNVAGLLWKNLI